MYEHNPQANRYLELKLLDFRKIQYFPLGRRRKIGKTQLQLTILRITVLLSIEKNQPQKQRV